jgi:electron transfer flavoprotein alpha subunit
MAIAAEGSLLWQPSQERLEQAGLTRYMRWLKDHKGLEFTDYHALWQWSVDHIEDFWESIWQYYEIKSSAPYTRVLAEMIGIHRPSVLLLGATPLGRDLAPRLSRRLDLGLTADCTELAIDPQDHSLLQTRPAFGGNVMATIVTPRARPQMATVRPGVMALGPHRQGATAQVLRHAVHLQEGDLLPRLLASRAQGQKAVDLAAARVIVAAGRGCGGSKGLELLSRLAEGLGGEVGGTRVAVEEGWLAASRQIGQTGVSVRPELYIACGVSGAIQHRAGCLGARYIVAINRDRRAPIFQVADYALVGDLFKVVPALLAALPGGA